MPSVKPAAAAAATCSMAAKSRESAPSGPMRRTTIFPHSTASARISASCCSDGFPFATVNPFLDLRQSSPTPSAFLCIAPFLRLQSASWPRTRFKASCASDRAGQVSVVMGVSTPVELYRRGGGRGLRLSRDRVPYRTDRGPEIRRLPPFQDNPSRPRPSAHLSCRRSPSRVQKACRTRRGTLKPPAFTPPRPPAAREAVPRVAVRPARRHQGDLALEVAQRRQPGPRRRSPCRC